MATMKLQTLIFLALMLIAPKSNATDLIYSEVLLKKLAQRIEKLLSESTQAQVFLEEDLTGAFKTLQHSEIDWGNHFNEAPYVFNHGRAAIGLSQFYSFKGSLEQQVELVTEILFNIKRQLEGSSVSIPQTRIQLFARKFSPLLLTESDSCSVSISPLKARLGQSQRDELTLSLVSQLATKGYAYESTWGTNVVWIEGKEKNDAGCRGRNRNIMTLSASLVSIPLQVSQLIADVEGTSCGYETTHKDEAVKKLIRKLKNNLPKCDRAFGN